MRAIQPTIYTAEARDGTVRMALHRMEEAPWLGGIDEEVVWPFRVVWSMITTDWFKSCRCTEGRDSICLGNVDAAIAWLLQGEEEQP